VSEDAGLSLDKLDLSALGRAKKVTISKDDTIVLDGAGEKSAIAERCDQLRESIDASTSDYDREKLQVCAQCHLPIPDHSSLPGVISYQREIMSR